MTFASMPRTPSSATASSIRSRPAHFPQTHPALPQPAGRRHGRASTSLTDEQWVAHFGRFEPLPGSVRAAAGPALPRPSVPGLQPRPRRRPRLPVRASCDDRGRPPARPCDQGLGPHALVAQRRRAADPEGRRARGAGDRDAGGAAASTTSKIVLADRDRRGAGARRRAVARRAPSVLVRLSHSHIRIGTFQRLTYLQGRRATAARCSTTRSPPTTRSWRRRATTRRAANFLGGGERAASRG